MNGARPRPLTSQGLTHRSVLMELFFLIALLAVVVWFNRGLLGFGSKGCDWVGADASADDGSRKWMCARCGRVEVTKTGAQPPNCAQPPE